MTVLAGYQSLQALDRYYVIAYLHTKKEKRKKKAEHAQEIKAWIAFLDVNPTLLKDSMTQFISRMLFVRNLS